MVGYVSWKLGLLCYMCLHIFWYSDNCSEWCPFTLLLTTKTLPTICNWWQMRQHTIYLYCLVCLAVLCIDLLVSSWFLLTVEMQAQLMRQVINFQIFCVLFRLISIWLFFVFLLLIRKLPCRSHWKSATPIHSMIFFNSIQQQERLQVGENTVHCI